jgi:hypothetical protein
MDGGLELFLAGTQNAATIPVSQSSSASASTVLDTQAHPVTANGKSVVRNSAGAIILDSAQVVHSIRR